MGLGWRTRRWEWVEYDGGKRDAKVDGTGGRVRDMGIQVCS
jgi:hypothetical protein